MKKQNRSIVFYALGLLLISGCQAGQPVATGRPDSPVTDRITYLRYSNLSELVTGVCDDAGHVFTGFYEPDDVVVSPFAVISDYRVEKPTMLGITLADQMAAMINSTPASRRSSGGKRHVQTMHGVIEEMDGYLRVHISGRNGLGERRGYVAHVEMSEPIYRFLHSSVESH